MTVEFAEMKNYSFRPHKNNKKMHKYTTELFKWLIVVRTSRCGKYVCIRSVTDKQCTGFRVDKSRG